MKVLRKFHMKLLQKMHENELQHKVPKVKLSHLRAVWKWSQWPSPPYIQAFLTNTGQEGFIFPLKSPKETALFAAKFTKIMELIIGLCTVSYEASEQHGICEAICMRSVSSFLLLSSEKHLADDQISSFWANNKEQEIIKIGRKTRMWRCDGCYEQLCQLLKATRCGSNWYSCGAVNRFGGQR